MAGYYVRRGEKVIGPIDKPQLKRARRDRQVATDRPFGREPLWAVARGKQNEVVCAGLAASKRASVPAVARPPQPLAVPQPAAQQQTESEGPIFTIVRVGKTVFATVGRGMLVASGAVGRAIAKSAERRHEIKLAKIKAQSDRYIAEAQRPQAQSASTPPVPAAPAAPITFAPQMVQTTVVNITNRTATRTGCGGCGCLLLILLAVIVFVILSNLPPSATRP